MKKALLLSLFLFSVLSFSTVYAHEGFDHYSDLTSPKTNREGTAAALKEKRAEMGANRCEGLEQKIDNRIEEFNNNKARHIEAYTQMVIKITNAIKTLEDKGYDVSKLREDLQTLNTLVMDYKDLFTEFIDLLVEARQYPCGESEGKFKEALQVAFAKLKEVHAKRVEIREFYKNTIRPDIKELREQKSENSARETTN